jgi:tRNA nucleotidyltransferase (CCA-adding enzyme)
MKKSYLSKLPKEIKKLVYLAREISTEQQIPAYLVGGIVRDLILGVKNFDLDIVVEGEGVKFAQAFAARLQAKIICHNRFGTATVSLPGHLKVDIATARKETYPHPAHLPQVSPGNLSDDLFRRDFSINAMALSISSVHFAEAIDFFCGLRDLRKKKIRILHDASFIDDPTRILRAIRFEQRYGFKIEPYTLNLLKGAVKAGWLEKVQPHRLRDELILIFKEEEPIRCLKRMKELSGFSFLHRNLSVSAKTYKLLLALKDEIIWFRKEYPQRRELDSWLIYLLGLLDSLKPADVQRVCKSFAFRRGEKKRILSAKDVGGNFLGKLRKKNLRPAAVFKLLEPLSYEVILLLKAKYKNKAVQKHINDFFEIYNGMRLVIGGEDLHRLGLKPGPYYQKIFSLVLTQKLEGKVRTKDEELALIKELISKK